MSASAEGALDVLLVEDDAPLREMLTFHLRREGWSIRAVDDGLIALAACAERPPDVVVLDVMLPGCDGIEVCRRLRRDASLRLGVLMLTARDAEIDVVLGFDVGADDYVVKPCRPRELVARIRALGRRVGRTPSDAPAGATLVRGALSIDSTRRLASVDGVPLKLTGTELALLTELALRPGEVLSRKTLLERVWDTSHQGYARNVDCHVTRVRRKLEAAGLDPAPITTVHREGYVFVSDAEGRRSGGR